MTRRGHNSTLAAPTKWIERKTPLSTRGGSMFKLADDDKAQWKWMYPMTQERGPCDCLLIPACHDAQEKNTGRFCTHRNVDLYAIAAAHTAQWRKETA